MGNSELRSKKVAKNAFWAIAGYMTYALAGFISRMIFVNKLGETITGVATLFNSILSLISITELGFSTAIAYHLYRPVAENDEKKITALLNFYNKTYKIIACSILSIGLLLTPFIDFFVKDNINIENLKLYFILYVLQTTLSYFYSYTTILFTVTQKSYIASNISNVFLTTTTLSQAVALHFTGSFILYLIVWIVGTFTSNVVIFCVAKKSFPYLEKHKNENLTKTEIKDVFSYVRATAIDKISLSVKITTDNIIISKFVNIVLTGKVGNYTMIINTVRTITNFFFNSVVPSLGNYILTEKKEKQYDVMLTLQLISFWMYGFLSAGMLSVISIFVSDLWLGDPSFIIPFSTLCLLILDFYSVGISAPLRTLFTLKGYIRKIPYINLLNVLANIIISILLVAKYGANGVYIGTVLSHILTTGWIEPFFVFKYHFDGNYVPYLKFFVKGVLITVITVMICVLISEKVILHGLFGMLLKAIICSAVYNSVFIIVYCRDIHFKAVVTIVRNIIKIA